MFEIIPGILEKDFAQIEKKIESAKSFAKTIHIDIIDGKFASNLTFLDPTPFKKYTDDFLFEVHLMVDEPINYLDSFATAGFKRFIGHIEHMSSQTEFVAKGELLGEVGLALDAQTPLENLDANYEDLDSILIMSVKAGESGQTFLPEVLEKIKKIKAGSEVKIEIDGGISDLTILQAKDAGVTRFISTSFIFSGDPQVNYQKLISIIHQS